MNTVEQMSCYRKLFKYSWVTKYILEYQSQQKILKICMKLIVKICGQRFQIQKAKYM